MASNAGAMERLRELKRRPQRPFSVHIGSPQDAEMYVADTSPLARRLAARGWPGPLTLALPKRDDLPANLSSLPTVGVRVPRHFRTREILAAAGGAALPGTAHRPRA